MKFVLVLLTLTSLFSSCNEIKLVNTKDILDLLKDDGYSNANSSSNSSQSPTTNQNGNSQNLNYYGLTDSPTGTNTFGSTGSTVGNPLGY
ncbi:hypothetical protein AB3N58_02645 [Leptospira sp. WS60.C2]